MRVDWYLAGARTVSGWCVVPVLEAEAALWPPHPGPVRWSCVIATVRVVALLLVAAEPAGGGVRLFGFGGPERAREVLAFLEGL